jgi:hypothetical protein
MIDASFRIVVSCGGRRRELRNGLERDIRSDARTLRTL